MSVKVISDSYNYVEIYILLHLLIVILFWWIWEALNYKISDNIEAIEGIIRIIRFHSTTWITKTTMDEITKSKEMYLCLHYLKNMKTFQICFSFGGLNKVYFASKMQLENIIIVEIKSFFKKVSDWRRISFYSEEMDIMTIIITTLLWKDIVIV